MVKITLWFLDASTWNTTHVQHWINWAIKQFGLKEVNPTQWLWIDGPALCNFPILLNLFHHNFRSNYIYFIYIFIYFLNLNRPHDS